MLDNLSLIPTDISINNSQNNLNFGTGFLDISNQPNFQSSTLDFFDSFELDNSFSSNDFTVENTPTYDFNSNLDFGTGFLDVSNQYGFQSSTLDFFDSFEINTTPQTFNFDTYEPTPPLAEASAWDPGFGAGVGDFFNGLNTVLKQDIGAGFNNVTTTGGGLGDFATNYVMSSEFREESNDSIFSWFDETLDSATDYVSETIDNPSKPFADIWGWGVNTYDSVVDGASNWYDGLLEASEYDSSAGYIGESVANGAGSAVAIAAGLTPLGRGAQIASNLGIDVDNINITNGVMKVTTDDAKKIDPKDFEELVNYAKANGADQLTISIKPSDFTAGSALYKHISNGELLAGGQVKRYKGDDFYFVNFDMRAEGTTFKGNMVPNHVPNGTPNFENRPVSDADLFADGKNNILVNEFNLLNTFPFYNLPLFNGVAKTREEMFNTIDNKLIGQPGIMLIDPRVDRTGLADYLIRAGDKHANRQEFGIARFKFNDKNGEGTYSPSFVFTNNLRNGINTSSLEKFGNGINAKLMLEFHNHPSGNVYPSEGDRMSDVWFGKNPVISSMIGGIEDYTGDAKVTTTRFGTGSLLPQGDVADINELFSSRLPEVKALSEPISTPLFPKK